MLRGGERELEESVLLLKPTWANPHQESGDENEPLWAILVQG